MRLEKQSIRSLIALGVMILLFVALKLLGVVTWSWWLVLSPLWVSLIFGVIIGIVLLVYFLLNKGK